jgi:hypothetical protein
MSLTMEVTGINETIAKLAELRSSMQKRLVEGAGRAALKPVVADVRARVPVGEGWLRKSIGTKKSKKNLQPGEIVLSVGARFGFNHVDVETGKNVDPFFYSIPVEYGHVVKNPYTGQVVGWIAPAGMFRAAYERGRVRVVDDFANELETRIGEVMR